MTRRFRRGLVVGKFSPLHRGHELLIRRAFEVCDEVVLLTYSKPELPGCDASERARWLEELFPTARRLVLTDEALREAGLGHLRLPANDASDDDQRAFVGAVCRDVLGCPVDAVFTSEPYGDGFARALGAAFRLWHRDAPQVAHVLVDRERRSAPVSGSMIRADVHAHRESLSPAVYASFVERVCLLGGESSGKTTQAAALAKAFSTAWVPEYGRRLWEEKRGKLVFDDELVIAERQVASERERARSAVRWLFCDGSPLTVLFYSLDLFGRADPRLEALARRPYRMTFLCVPDFPFVQDGTRRDETFRKRQHEWYLRELRRSGADFAILAGTMAERTARATAVLGMRAAGPR